jgi:hypothetical protein
MIATMPRKQSDAKRPAKAAAPTDQHKGQPVFLRLHPRLAAALKQAAKRGHRPVTSEARLAITEHLRKLGLWTDADQAAVDDAGEPTGSG